MNYIQYVEKAIFLIQRGYVTDKTETELVEILQQKDKNKNDSQKKKYNQ